MTDDALRMTLLPLVLASQRGEVRLAEAGEEAAVGGGALPVAAFLAYPRLRRRLASLAQDVGVDPVAVGAVAGVAQVIGLEGVGAVDRVAAVRAARQVQTVGGRLPLPLRHPRRDAGV